MDHDGNDLQILVPCLDEGHDGCHYRIKRDCKEILSNLLCYNEQVLQVFLDGIGQVISRRSVFILLNLPREFV